MDDGLGNDNWKSWKKNGEMDRVEVLVVDFEFECELYRRRVRSAAAVVVHDDVRTVPNPGRTLDSCTVIYTVRVAAMSMVMRHEASDSDDCNLSGDSCVRMEVLELAPWVVASDREDNLLMNLGQTLEVSALYAYYARMG